MALRSVIERIAEDAGVALQITVGCSSYLQAAQILESGRCAAALPDLALASLDRSRFHRLALPHRYPLHLAWSGRNADTRPGLARLIGEFAELGRFDGEE